MTRGTSNILFTATLGGPFEGGGGLGWWSTGEERRD